MLQNIAVQTAIDQLHDSSADYVGALLSVFPGKSYRGIRRIESMLNGKEDNGYSCEKHGRFHQQIHRKV